MRIGVAGCMGRVGQLLVSELLSGDWEGLDLAGGTKLASDKVSGDFFVTENAEDLFERADAVIDFTCPTATRHHAALAAKHKKILVAGTTGLSADDEKQLQAAAKDTAIVYAANMSVGVNMLLALVEQAAAKLGPEWDIEIFESHHKHKVDAPSGTALAIGKAAAAGRGSDFDALRNPPCDGHTGARESGKIGFSVARGGDVVGEHTAFFFGEGERLELTHKATNRALFARGALHAAKWAANQKPGLYAMRDVLGL